MVSSQTDPRRVLGKRANAVTARLGVVALTTFQHFRIHRGLADIGQTRHSDRPDPRNLYGLLTNLSAVLVVVAVVAAFLRFIDVVPAWLFGVLFTATAAVLVTLAASRRHRRPEVARVLLGWATIPVAVAIGSGAELLNLTGFVPDLVLAWICVVLAFGLWSDSAPLLSVSVGAATAWGFLSFLYDYSLLPGFAVLAVGVGYLLRRGRTVPLLVVCTISAVTLTQLAAYDLLHPTHYPLSFDPAHLALALAAWGGAIALWGALANTDRHRWVWAPAKALHAVLIFLIYLTFTAPQAWRLVHTSFANQATLPLGLGAFAVVAAAVLWQHGTAGLWVRLALWFAAFVAVWLSNHGFPPMLLGVVAGLVALAMGWLKLTDSAPAAVATGALMVAAVAAVSWISWQLPFAVGIGELLLTALVIGRAARGRTLTAATVAEGQ